VCLDCAYFSSLLLKVLAENFRGHACPVTLRGFQPDKAVENILRYDAHDPDVAKPPVISTREKQPSNRCREPVRNGRSIYFFLKAAFAASSACLIVARPLESTAAGKPAPTAPVNKLVMTPKYGTSFGPIP
jgi:hypothetical protein